MWFPVPIFSEQTKHLAIRRTTSMSSESATGTGGKEMANTSAFANPEGPPFFPAVSSSLAAPETPVEVIQNIEPPASSVALRSEREGVELLVGLL